MRLREENKQASKPAREARNNVMIDPLNVNQKQVASTTTTTTMMMLLLLEHFFLL